ncbi:MAG: lamin tail domain-containing protein [Acidobacteria bacterium]|nr:lamin tail domain-containing protein [Acidobacteriota bacterium]
MYGLFCALIFFHEHHCECATDLRVLTKGAEVVVITEIMQNPSAVADTEGEWFELYNPGPGPVNLNGWRIRDDGSDLHIVNTDVVIQAGQYAVLGRNANATTNGGIFVHYQYAGITLSNGADELVIERPDQSLVDRVAYDGGPTWPDPAGASMELNSAFQDNNQAVNWAEATNVLASGDRGTPGEGPDGLVAAGLIITEVMQNPSAVADSAGEWFEVYNPGTQSVNMNGWTISDQGTDSHLIQTDVVINGGSFAVLGRNANQTTNGGVVVNYQYASFNLTNGADEIILTDDQGQLVDEIIFDGGPAWPNPTGASMALMDLNVDNSLGSNWIVSTEAMPNGDFGTPGTGPGGGGGGSNQSPSVWAGPDETVYLDALTANTSLFGMASDPNGDPLTYQWTLVSGNGSAATLSNGSVLKPVASFTAQGLFTFQLMASDGQTQSIDTVSIRVTSRPLSTGQYGIYFGNVHAHSSYSDGNKGLDPLSDGAAAGFRYARDLGGLDWLVMSDHNHQAAGMDYADYAAGVSEANTVNGESNDFVAIFGTEWGTISSGGHVIYSHDQLWGWEPGNYDVFVDKGDYNALFQQIGSVASFGQLCHPGSDHFNNIFNQPYNAAWDDAVSAVSVKSGPAFATALDYSESSASNYESYYLNLLQKGYRVGPAGDQDTHYDNWGLANEQRTAVLANSLSQADILEALRAGRVYATEDYNLAIDLWVQVGGNDFGMASTVDVAVGGNSVIQVATNDPDGESTSLIELFAGDVGGGTATVVQSSMTSSLTHNFSPQSNGQERYFFARITQADGQRAWSAPIWIRGSSNVAPVASFNYSVSGLNVSFTDESVDTDGSIVSRSWSFGDGATSTSVNPQHGYAAGGNYQVTLTVTDNDGASAVVSQQISLSTGPITEQLSASIGGRATHTYTRSVSGGVIDISVSWTQSRRDLDIYVYGPSGSLVAMSESVANPETLQGFASSPGIYTIQIYNYTSRNTNYVMNLSYEP